MNKNELSALTTDEQRDAVDSIPSASLEQNGMLSEGRRSEKKIMTIKNYIETVAKLIPIEWDRFIENNGDYDIYGWIKRKDGQRDFVLFQLYIENEQIKGTFCTSSAKYSKDIFMCLYGTTKGHNKCRKINELVV